MQQPLLFCSFVQFFAHLVANLFAPLVIDLRVDCKGRTGLCVSGFCGYCRHDDLRVDRKSVVVANHEVRSPKGKERGRILGTFLIKAFLPTPSHQFFLGSPILIIFFEEVHVLWSNVHIADVAFLCGSQLVAEVFEH